jgi:hypothetical protein
MPFRSNFENRRGIQFLSWFALNRNMPVMTLHNPVNNGKPQTCSDLLFFCGKKGIKYTFQNSRFHTATLSRTSITHNPLLSSPDKEKYLFRKTAFEIYLEQTTLRTHGMGRIGTKIIRIDEAGMNRQKLHLRQQRLST